MLNIYIYIYIYMRESIKDKLNHSIIISSIVHIYIYIYIMRERGERSEGEKDMEKSFFAEYLIKFR